MFVLKYLPQVWQDLKPFSVQVSSLEEAVLVATSLIKFSAYEFDNNLKYDYSDYIRLEDMFENEIDQFDDADSFSSYLDTL